MAKRAVIIDILSDAKSFVKGSKDAGAAADSLDSKTKQLGRTLVSAYAAKRIEDFGQAAVTAAMADAAGQRILATALANTTGATDEQVAAVEDWIDATQRALGVADDELRPALSTLAASTKDVAEAQDLLGLALDTSRAKGIPLEVVAKAIAKAHDGNTAALTKLVPGLKQSGEKTLDFATAMERLNTQVAGQAAAWAKTDEGKLARMNVAWDEMQETLGTALLPVMGQLIGIVSTVFDWFNSLDESTQQFIVTVVLLGGALYVGVAAINAIKVAVQGLGLSASAAAPWLAGIGLVVGAIGVAMELFGDEEETVKVNTNELSAALAGATSRLDLQRLAFLDAAAAAREYKGAVFEDIDELTREAIRGNAGLVDVLNLTGVSMEEVVAATHDYATGSELANEIGRRMAATLGDGAELTDEQGAALTALTQILFKTSVTTAEFTAAQVELAKAGDIAAIEYLKAAGLLDLLTPAQQAAAEAMLDTAAAAEAQGGAMDTAATATQGLGDNTATTAAKVIELADAAGELKRAFDEIIGPSMNLEQSQRRLLDAAQATAVAILENGKTLDINTDAGRNNRDAVQAQAEAMLGQADAMIRSGSTTAEATAFALAYREELGAQLTALGLNQTEVDDYLTTLGLTPENVTTSLALANKEVVAKQLTDVLKQLEGVDAGAVADIQAMIDEGDFAAAADAINALPGHHTTLVGVASDGSSVTLKTSGGGAGGTFGIRYLEHGGPAYAGQPIVVGEKRPELFVPNVDGWILPKVPTGFSGAPAGPSDGSTGGGQLFRDLIVRDDRSINDELEVVMALQGFRL